MQQLSFRGSCSRIERWSTKQSRLFVSVEGENVLEHLRNRFDRPVAEYKRLLAPILQSLGVKKVRWSQKAGCSCGCSPGFVLDRKVFINDSFRGNDLFVTITGAPVNQGNPREI